MPSNRVPCWISLFSILLLSGFGSAEAVEEQSGEQIYLNRCASCHGPNGQGTKDNYAKVLAGDRSVAQLAGLISKTMPEDDPGTCTGAEADRVAAYIYHEFYSPTARARNAPARIELSRLTVRQYRNAVAELIGGFRAPSKPLDNQHGLRGEYFKSRRFRNNERLIERVDPEVKFDFGVKGPDPEAFAPNEFSIRWEGSVLAPDTGEYEFIVRTEHSMRFWLNDMKKPFIDALVKSGADTEYRASITLIGGRAYPLRLEFSKAKQGVDDSKKYKDKPIPEVKASVALLWKPPHKIDEVIPARNLTPQRVAESLVVTTPFPPDDRSIGYERGTSVSKEWDQAATSAAIETAGYVMAHLGELSGVRDDAADRAVRLREFVGRFAERAFRRPLTDDQKALYVNRPFESTSDLELGVKRALLLVLKSPRFLFHDFQAGPLDSYDIAARIAFRLWDSLPDSELLDAARSGRLNDKAEVARQANRMLGDLRARSKLRAFFLQWLRVDQTPELSKDHETFPDFTPEIVADLRTSLELSLDDIINGESSDFRQVLLDDSLYLNGRLARFYGVDLPADAPFQKVPLDRGERSGLLTHPFLMAGFAYNAASSPIHRGVFIARSVLGRSLRPPPEAITPLPANLHPGLTTRERVATQTGAKSCQTCHAMINPLGFTLERFDAVGRYRKEEQGKPIDVSGGYLTRQGETVTFNGVPDLAAFLAESEETQSAFVEQLFHALVKQPVRAYGSDALPGLLQFFKTHDCRIRPLMVEIIIKTVLSPPDPVPSGAGGPPSAH